MRSTSRFRNRSHTVGESGTERVEVFLPGCSPPLLQVRYTHIYCSVLCHGFRPARILLFSRMPIRAERNNPGCEAVNLSTASSLREPLDGPIHTATGLPPEQHPRLLFRFRFDARLLDALRDAALAPSSRRGGKFQRQSAPAHPASCGARHRARSTLSQGFWSCVDAATQSSKARQST